MSSGSDDEDSTIAPFPDKVEQKPSPRAAAGGSDGVNEGGKAAAGSKDDAAVGTNGDDGPAMKMDDLEASGGSDPSKGKGEGGAGPEDGGTAAQDGDEGGEGEQNGGGEGGEEEIERGGGGKPRNRRVSEISESAKSLARSEDSEDGNDSRQSAAGEEEAEEEPMSEEELKEYQEKSNASLTLQRVVRGHVDRRRAAHTPVWCSYPMPQGTTGWSYSLPMGSLASADMDKLEHADRLEMLATVLEEGISSLPDQDSPTTDRPFATLRLRKDLVRDLVVWCCETAIGYLDQAFPQPAIFLLTSVDTLCEMCESPLGLKLKAQFQGCGNLHIWALDRLAMIRFKASEIYESLELLDRALAVYEASAGAVGRLPFVLIQSHRACCFTMLSQHETAMRTLELLLPAFSSVAMLPMGKHATLLDAHDVIAHGLIVAVHNTAVSLTYLGRHDEAKNARVRSLSLLSVDDFPHQPMGRVLSYAYSACLHPSKPPELPHIVRPQTQKNTDRSVSFTDSNQLAETGGSGAGQGGAAGSSSWRRWLAVVGEGDNLAPVWLHCPAPPARAKQQVLDEFKDQATEVEKALLKATAELSTQNHLVISANASAADANAGDNGARRQTEVAGDEVSIDLGVSAIEPIAKEEGEVAGEPSFVAELDELVADDLEASAALDWDGGEISAKDEEGKVPMTAKRVVEKSGSSSEVEVHMERLCKHALQGGGGLATASEVLKLLSPSVYPDCGKLSWGAHVYALSTMAGVLYVEERDWRGAAGYAEQAASVAQEEGGVAKKHAAYCRLQAAACAFRLGNYAKAFSLGKEALGYTQVVTEDEAQDGDVRRSLEDVVTAGCHVMALSHLNLGTSKTALALSKTAVEHIKGSSFADKSGPDFARVYRAHQIAMSMKQLTSVRSSVQALTTKRDAGGSTWTATRSKLDPNLFVPGALANNLPSSGSRWRSGRSSGAATPDRYGPESLIASQLDGLEHGAEASPSGPRYKWTGKYVEWEEKAPPLPGKADLDYEEPPDKVTLSELKAVLPRSPLAKGLLRDTKPENKSSAKSAASDNGHAGTSLMSSSNKATAPRQRVLKMAGVTNKRSASAEPLPAHRDVAVTLTHWGPEEEKARTLTTARSALNSSRMYFAQTMSRGRTRVESPLPNNAPLQKDGRIPPQLGSRPATVMRDWGPDPTSSLLSLSRGIASKLRGKGDTGGVAAASKAKTHEKEEGGAKNEPVTVGTNIVRIGKHDPYDTVTKGSLLSLFGQPGTRRELVRDMEARSGIIVKDMEWTRQLPDIRDKAMTRHEERAERERKDVSLSRRPFYWSHPPEESVYSHGPKSASNKGYRALPYGTMLTPAAKLAYGAAPMTPSIGNRSSGGVVVDRGVMLEYADLTRKSPVTGGFKASRSLTSFY